MKRRIFLELIAGAAAAAGGTSFNDNNIRMRSNRVDSWKDTCMRNKCGGSSKDMHSRCGGSLQTRNSTVHSQPSMES